MEKIDIQIMKHLNQKDEQKKLEQEFVNEVHEMLDTESIVPKILAIISIVAFVIVLVILGIIKVYSI